MTGQLVACGQPCGQQLGPWLLPLLGPWLLPLLGRWLLVWLSLQQQLCPFLLLRLLLFAGGD
jgi:hypothetical protein